MVNYFNFLAGIALMLLGIRALREGADRYFGARFRKMFQTATKGSLRAMATGFWVSILMPSSTAVALLAVESIDAGYANLPQMLALMLGANIGFTATVQLLAFKFYAYYGPFIFVGAPLFLFARRQNIRGAGQAIMGLGFLLLSIEVLAVAVAPIKDNAEIVQIIQVTANHPIWLMLVGVVLSVVVQSSTTAIGIAIVLCSEHVLTVDAALAVVLGANLGIGVTTLLTGLRHVVTRQMAVGNLAFKIIGVIVLLPVLPWVGRMLAPFSLAGGTHDTQLIANVHTAFNVGLAIIFLPLVPAISRILEKLMPKQEDTLEGDGPRYLDPAALMSPALALGQATREILHLADHVRLMLRDCHRCLEDADESVCALVQSHDDVVDKLNNEIKTYITKISERSLSPADSQREIALLAFAGDLENIGDIIDMNLVELARKKASLGVQFSPEGKADLNTYYTSVMENFEMALSAFASQDRALAEQLVQRKHLMNDRERELRDRHFHRLNAGLHESFETSSIHLDVLMNLKHINSLLTAVAYPILEPKPA